MFSVNRTRPTEGCPHTVRPSKVVRSRILLAFVGRGNPRGSFKRSVVARKGGISREGDGWYVQRLGGEAKVGFTLIPFWQCSWGSHRVRHRRLCLPWLLIPISTSRLRLVRPAGQE